MLNMSKHLGIINFLKTGRPKEELRAALETLKEFKENESRDEWLRCSWESWVKLEQLEEYLEYLVNNKSLKNDTLEVLKKHAES